jgi:hypothetical protein
VKQVDKGYLKFTQKEKENITSDNNMQGRDKEESYL